MLCLTICSHSISWDRTFTLKSTFLLYLYKHPDPDHKSEPAKTGENERNRHKSTENNIWGEEMRKVDHDKIWQRIWSEVKAIDTPLTSYPFCLSLNSAGRKRRIVCSINSFTLWNNESIYLLITNYNRMFIHSYDTVPNDIWGGKKKKGNEKKDKNVGDIPKWTFFWWGGGGDFRLKYTSGKM